MTHTFPSPGRRTHEEPSPNQGPMIPRRSPDVHGSNPSTGFTRWVRLSAYHSTRGEGPSAPTRLLLIAEGSPDAPALLHALAGDALAEGRPALAEQITDDLASRRRG